MNPPPCPPSAPLPASSSWDSLSPDAQRLVAQQLKHSASLASMRATCRSMRAAVNHDDIWEAASVRLTGHPCPPAPLPAHRTFALEVARERRRCRDLGDKLHELRRLQLAQSIPVGARGGMIITPPRQSNLQSSIDHLSDQREEIVAPFAAEGLRAKPWSLRQRGLRAFNAWLSR